MKYLAMFGVIGGTGTLIWLGIHFGSRWIDKMLCVGPLRLDGTDEPWKRWFAWYPVQIETDRSSDRVWKHWFWLRWIERRLRPDGAPPLDTPKVQYRLPQYAGRVGGPTSRDTASQGGDK